MKTLEQRFKEKLGEKDPVTGCIEWLGAKRELGHGQIHRDGKRESTHRIAYELANGPIPDGMWVLHRCDNPPCCNPDHLFLGTHDDNMKDMTSKGRGSKGEGRPLSKLSNEDVSEIKNRLKTGSESQRKIASEFGVSKSTINLINKGKTWTHI